MGFLPRRAGLFRRPPRPADRYGHRSRGANEPSFPPSPPSAPVHPGDPVDLLGRSLLAARTQQVCRTLGLDLHGPLSRSYAARDRGLEIAADTHGTVTTVFLHLYGDDGFASWDGELPCGAGAVPRRAALWAALGRPDTSGDPYSDRFLGDYGPWDRWELPSCALHAQ